MSAQAQVDWDDPKSPVPLLPNARGRVAQKPTGLPLEPDVTARAPESPVPLSLDQLTSATTSTAASSTAAAPSEVAWDEPPERTWMDSVSDFGKEVWNKVNPISNIKGAAQATSHPIDTLKSDASARQEVYDRAEAAFKKGDYAKGAGHLLYSVLPFIGPQLDQAANDFLQGDYAKGAGASVGMGLSMAGPGALKDMTASMPGVRGLANRMYQSALKPGTTVENVSGIVQTGLENRIPVSAGGLTKMGDLIDDLNDKVTAEIQSGSRAGTTINKFDVANRLRDTSKQFGTQVNPTADLQDVRESGQEFIRTQPTNIPATEAQALKVGTYQQIANKYGTLSQASIEAQKALARGIKEELEQQFPEIGGLNAAESKLLSFEPVLTRAVNRITNRNIFSLGGKIAAAGGAAVGGMPGAAVAAVMHEVLSMPELQSRLAVGLYRAGKGTITFSAAKARIAGYVNALGSLTEPVRQPEEATATAGP